MSCNVRACIKHPFREYKINIQTIQMRLYNSDEVDLRQFVEVLNPTYCTG